ncbi:MAG: YqaA family protein [Nanoarchaeota archaeon]
MKKADYLEIEDNEKLILPSELENQKIKKRLKSTRKSLILKRLKWIFIIFMIFILYLFYEQIYLYLINIIKGHPTIYNYYLIIESEIQNNTLRGLFFVSILGSLFFIVLPSEALFIYYLNSTDYGAGTIMVLTLLGCIVGFTINYFAGRILGERIVKLLFRKNYPEYKKKIEKYGGYVLVIGGIVPGPIEALAVFYGAFKFGFFRYIYLIFIGRFIKYLILLFFFVFYWEEFIVFYDIFIDNVLILKELYIQ